MMVVSSTSTTRARKTSTSCSTCGAGLGGDLDLHEAELADERGLVREVVDAEHVDQLVEVGLDDAGAGRRYASTTTVRRETPGWSVRPTVSDSMLKLRRRKSDATRLSTPGMSST